jgi:WhiB family redox-sensing transcriptional regulator
MSDDVTMGPSGRVLRTASTSPDEFRLPAEPWMLDALCAQTDPEIFFPEKGGSSRAAKSVCARCDVREQCLRYALEHDEKLGIYGGLAPRERRALMKARAAA